MSAFVVRDETINKIVTFLANDRECDYIRRHIAKKLGIVLSYGDGPATLGNLMFSLNCEAVNERYGENQASEFRPLNYRFTPEIHATMMSAFKQLECWLYQCSEGNIPENNELYKVMDEIAGDIARKLVHHSAAYENSPWN